MDINKHLAKPSLDEQRYQRLLRQGKVLREIEALYSVLEIKRAMLNEDESYAELLWHELDEPTQRALWVAPTYGGVFSTREREMLKRFGVQWSV